GQLSSLMTQTSTGTGSSSSTSTSISLFHWRTLLITGSVSSPVIDYLSLEPVFSNT
ncbi:hypothetical protein L9F63_019061, partial [Diploptera punctata]